MLQLKQITKDYVSQGSCVHALKGVSLSFRRHEFVSVLGPSGCGKTTLLNIIGGLDHYTDGDLQIDGTSTKDYTDRDWDTYRNHRIGFVFQSYNLIPHQTISENVELALAISGVDKSERVRRAHEALDKVGLAGLYSKKPNQLSGGQCQRVAIARALVNDPEILLADEPTGALDTATSVQIMDLIKEISSDCLVIMVTHNPELAERYSTRIVRLLDGEVQSDSMPYDEAQEVESEKSEIVCDDTKETGCDIVADASSNGNDNTNEKHTRTKKPKSVARKSKLSFSSTFALSAKNLMSKFKRTILVCLAGAIGIIGVASVLSVSTGVQNYIDNLQNDMLSGNPVTINEEAMNLSSMMSGANRQTERDALKAGWQDGYINVDATIDYLVSRGNGMSNLKVTNDITEDYLSYVQAMPKEYYNAIAISNGIDVASNVYTDYVLDGYTNSQRISLAAAEQIYTSILEQTEYKDYASYVSMLSQNLSQASVNGDFIMTQYDLIAGEKVASEKNELMIVVGEDGSLSDLLLAQLGYYTQEEFTNTVYKAAGDSRYNPALDKKSFSYEELLGKTFVWYPNDVVFEKTNSASPLSAINPFTYSAYEQDDFEGGITLTVTSILKQKDGLSYGCLSSGFYYTSALCDEIVKINSQSQIVDYLKTEDKDSITSMSYNSQNVGITYQYSFFYDGAQYMQTGFVGKSGTSGILASLGGQSTNAHTITMRELGGCTLPDKIEIYPADFTRKDDVTAYISKWNEDGAIEVNGKVLQKSDRSEIVYTDNLAIVISLIDNMIDVVTAALVAFTALSLVVSTVMIAIITYVSVIERIKEIGVIRSLGGRKSDVSRLFDAETFIIGSISGLIGVGITYILCAIINAVVKSVFGITTIATLTFPTALIMFAISIVLTMIAGLIPASLAAKKDPVEALRSE